MSGPDLREYQREAVDALHGYLAREDGAPLVVIPTGGGKSHVIAAFLRESLEPYPKERALVLVHVRELVAQNAQKLRSHWQWGPIGIYSAGLGYREIRQITVASVQSVYRRARELSPISLVVVDEAHRIPRDGGGMYLRILSEIRAENPGVRIVGLSATPYRTGTGYLHEGEGALFDSICYEVSVRDLIAGGYLCRLRTKLGMVVPDLSRVPVRAGEYVTRELEEAVDPITSSAVAEIAAFTRDRSRILVFCIGVRHAAHVAEALNNAGIPSAVVTGETPSEERDRVLAAFRAGEIRAVANVDVLTTGYDEPGIDCLVFLRPTKSPGLYVQMAGRGMRLAPGKTDCLVLDFAGNIERHGPIDSVEPRRKGDSGGAAPIKACPACREAVPLALPICPECGYAFPPPPPKYDETASAKPIISDDPHARVTFDVEQVFYRRHEKAGKPPSMRVDYSIGLSTSISEWVCFEHPGYAGEKARQWWVRRARTTPPATVEEALERAEEELPTPARIVADVSGKYPEIKGFEWHR